MWVWVWERAWVLQLLHAACMSAAMLCGCSSASQVLRQISALAPVGPGAAWLEHAAGIKGSWHVVCESTDLAKGRVWGLSGIRLGLGPVCFVAQLVEGLGWEQSQQARGLALGQAQGSEQLGGLGLGLV